MKKKEQSKLYQNDTGEKGKIKEHRVTVKQEPLLRGSRVTVNKPQGESNGRTSGGNRGNNCGKSLLPRGWVADQGLGQTGTSSSTLKRPRFGWGRKGKKLGGGGKFNSRKKKNNIAESVGRGGGGPTEVGLTVRQGGFVSNSRSPVTLGNLT